VDSPCKRERREQTNLRGVDVEERVVYSSPPGQVWRQVGRWGEGVEDSPVSNQMLFQSKMKSTEMSEVRINYLRRRASNMSRGGWTAGITHPNSIKIGSKRLNKHHSYL